MQTHTNGFKFQEMVDDKSPAVEAWGGSDSHAVLTYRIPWADWINDCPAAILGYSYFKSSTRMLARRLPIQHPRIPWFWATKITNAQGVKSTGMGTLPGANDPSAVYESVDATILFQSLPFAVMSDSDLLAISTPNGILDESLRFVEYTEKTRTESISVQQGDLVYREGPLVNQTIPSQRYINITKQDISLKWYNVADGFVMQNGTAGAYNGSPTNILGCVNKVNKLPFLGRPAGTLLCKGYTREPVEAPTAPANLSDVSLAGSPGYPPRLWNLIIDLTFYDPPFDPDFTTHRGWNLQPQKQLGAGTGTRYFYYATGPTKDGVQGLPLYDSIDFGSGDGNGTGLFRCPPVIP
jgi:hypothetical protein